MKYFEDIFKDTTFTINERIRNPYWFSFIVVFVIYNLNSIVSSIGIYKKKSIPIDQRLNEILNLDWCYLEVFFIALLALAVLYFIQYLGLIISILFQDRIKPYLLKVVSSKRIATREKVVGLTKLLENQIKENDDLNDQLSRSTDKFEAQTNMFTTEINDYKKKVEKIEKELTETKGELESQTNKLYDCDKSKSDLVQHNFNLEQQNNSLEQSIVSLEDQLEGLRKVESEIDEIKSRNENLIVSRSTNQKSFSRLFSLLANSARNNEIDIKIENILILIESYYEFIFNNDDKKRFLKSIFTYLEKGKMNILNNFNHVGQIPELLNDLILLITAMPDDDRSILLNQFRITFDDRLKLD